MADNGSVVTGSSGKSSSVTRLLLDVANNSTFGALGDGEDVTDVEGGLLTAVDESTSGKTLGGNEGLGLELVSVRVSENDVSQGSSSTGVVDDVLDETTDVTVSLSKVQRPQSSRLLSVVSVGLEDPSGLSLVKNDSTHDCERRGGVLKMLVMRPSVFSFRLDDLLDRPIPLFVRGHDLFLRQYSKYTTYPQLVEF